MLDEFVNNLHKSCSVISRGKATVFDREVDAVMIRNLYGQELVWGMFSLDRGKFKGKLANDAGTEGVVYKGDTLW